MITLFEQDRKFRDMHSSKGNQLKWENNGIWYKADHTGYEGLAEYAVSSLLGLSSLDKEEYAVYFPEQIRYGERILNGAGSRSFLKDGWQIITAERLFQNHFGVSLHTALWTMRDVRERLAFLCDQIIRITGLEDFGKYMTKMLTVDAFFKNEDRHTQNIAVLMDPEGRYRLCPIFDNGAALLADTSLDYPMEADVYQLLGRVQAKTVSTDFDEQLEAAEALFGRQLSFHFTHRDVQDILRADTVYGPEVKERVQTILFEQMRRYAYLFA